MYLRYWNLDRRPFNERVNPRWFFAAQSHQAAVTQLQDAVARGAAAALLCGGPGVGKSMVAAVLFDALPAGQYLPIRFDILPGCSDSIVGELFRRLVSEARRRQRGAGQLELPSRARPQAMAQVLSALGRHPVVLIDGAGPLSDAVLGGLIDLAAGLVEAGRKLTVLLVARTELLVRMERTVPGAERACPRCLLGPMSGTETAGYMSRQLRLAGGSPALIDPAATQLVHELSQGVPRRVNRLCDLSLLIGFAEGADRVGPQQVWKAQGELQPLGPTRTAVEPRRRCWRRRRPPSVAGASPAGGQQATIMAGSRP